MDADKGWNDKLGSHLLLYAARRIEDVILNQMRDADPQHEASLLAQTSSEPCHGTIFLYCILEKVSSD